LDSPASVLGWVDDISVKSLRADTVTRTDDLLAAIEAVHAAGLDAERWPEALGSVTQLIGGVGAAFEVIDKATSRHTQFYHAGLPPADQPAYLDHYAKLSPRLAFGLRQRASVVTWDYQFIEEAAIDRSPFYMEFLSGMDCRYFVAAAVADDPTTFAGIGVQRSARHGHVDQAGIDLMRRLLPHFRQAFDVARRFRTAGGLHLSLEHALDWLADGVTLVGLDGSVVYANASFRAIVKRRDGIVLRKGAIEFTEAAARTRFDAIIGSLGRLLAGADVTAEAADFFVRRPSGATPFLVSIRPLFEATAHLHGKKNAALIIFVRDPECRHSGATRALRQTFGLTEAEAGLAEALLHRVSLSDYAGSHGLSLNTVYTHLRRIKEKMSCKRLPELIQRLNDFRVPLRVE
jgi:DNA-binding CsgD family transcriptional regulator